MYRMNITWPRRSSSSFGNEFRSSTLFDTQNNGGTHAYFALAGRHPYPDHHHRLFAHASLGFSSGRIRPSDLKCRLSPEAAFLIRAWIQRISSYRRASPQSSILFDEISSDEFLRPGP
jgi:hypothetical protein